MSMSVSGMRFASLYAGINTERNGLAIERVLLLYLERKDLRPVFAHKHRVLEVGRRAPIRSLEAVVPKLDHAVRAERDHGLQGVRHARLQEQALARRTIDVYHRLFVKTLPDAVARKTAHHVELLFAHHMLDCPADVAQALSRLHFAHSRLK